jgi:hypothetical protein
MGAKKTSMGGDYITPTNLNRKDFSIGSSIGTPKSVDTSKSFSKTEAAVEPAMPIRRASMIVTAALNLKRRTSLAQQIFKDRPSVTSAREKRNKSMDSVKSLSQSAEEEKSEEEEASNRSNHEAGTEISSSLFLKL